MEEFRTLRSNVADPADMQGVKDSDSELPRERLPCSDQADLRSRIQAATQGAYSSISAAHCNMSLLSTGTCLRSSFVPELKGHLPIVNSLDSLWDQ